MEKATLFGGYRYLAQKIMQQSLNNNIENMYSNRKYSNWFVVTMIIHKFAVTCTNPKPILSKII